MNPFTQLNPQALAALIALFQRQDFQLLLNLIESEILMLNDSLVTPTTPEIDMYRLSQWRGAKGVLTFMKNLKESCEFELTRREEFEEESRKPGLKVVPPHPSQNR